MERVFVRFQHNAEFQYSTNHAGQSQAWNFSAGLHLTLRCVLADYLAAFDFIETLEEKASVEELVQAFQAFLSDFGFIAFCVGNPIAPKLALEDRVLVSTWPDEWNKIWFERNYVAVDPVVYQLLAQAVPFRWRDLRSQVTGHGAEVMDAARDFKFLDGIAIPVRSQMREIMGITMAGPNIKLTKREEMCIYMAAIYFHARLEQLKGKDRDEVKLTARERECLSWAAAGKTDWEISQILGISHETTKQHMKKTIAKLDAMHRAQAVALAIHKGIIAP